ncbi:MAG: two-component system alkaline phosphatase synthesis response regulator PhoP [Cryomorphaceae bacterium]|jgi:two-component system alkaline phosphatase synthesis response regulator PhoP
MNKIRVVAIDDVSDILELIQYNLEKEGMEVHTFTDGSKAVKHIAVMKPNVVICDWMMPEPDGLEVCRILKNHMATREIPIIMLTCKGDIQDYKKAMDAGASDYIAKPVRMDELIRRIKLLLPTDGRQRAQFG